MIEEFFDKTDPRRTSKTTARKEGRKNQKQIERFGIAELSFYEQTIVDIEREFFSEFFSALGNLEDEDISSLIEFINFPEGTKIELLGELTEEQILDEIEVALDMFMKYFDEKFETAYADFTQEFLEEGQIFILLKLSKLRHLFKFSKEGKEVFANKVKRHSRFAGRRMMIEKSAGAELKWTEERVKSVLERMRQLEEEVAKYKTLYLGDNAEDRAEKIAAEFPHLKPHLNSLNLLLTKEAMYSVSDLATQILVSELNELPEFNITSTSYLQDRLKVFKRNAKKAIQV